MPPSRARRQFAARLAQRRAEASAAAEADATAEAVLAQSQSQYAHGKTLEASPTQLSKGEMLDREREREGDPRSDDSYEGEGEDVGIVMRKTLGRSRGSSTQLGRSIFEVEGSDDDEEGEGVEEEEEEDDDDDVGGVAMAGLDVGTGKRELVDAFEEFGIDVRTPPADGVDED